MKPRLALPLAAALGASCAADPAATVDDVATSAAPLSLMPGNHQRWRVISEIDELIFDILDAYVDAAGWPAGLNCR